jgi:3-oxoacyl-(acyl-carrier-protein) synthase
VELNRVFVHGTGAVSPAGWTAGALKSAIASAVPLSLTDVARPGWVNRNLRVRPVPVPSPRPPFLANPRVRRTSIISHYLVAAALEALGGDAAKVSAGQLNLGVIVTMMSGCVNYSRRFYDETLRDPATASPLVFPETVFNAPSSHLAALLGATGINYTLVGDPGAFAQGLALAGDWLANGLAEACLVVGAEENDWLTADAFRLFAKNVVLSDGGGALYLCTDPSVVELERVTDSFLFTQQRSRSRAAGEMRRQLPNDAATLLCDGLQGVPRLDAAEAAAWNDWPGERLSIKRTLGEGLMAAATWQCVAAVQAIEQGRRAANVSIVGTNQQAIGARFVAVAK